MEPHPHSAGECSAASCEGEPTSGSIRVIQMSSAADE
jgi:hypothetical protein